MKRISIEARISNLEQFLEAWMELADSVERAAKVKRITKSHEEEYRKCVNRIAFLYPRVQLDIQRHGIRVVKTVPAGAGLIRNVPGYDPFLNFPTYAPTLSDLFHSRGYRSRGGFAEDWLLGRGILLHCLGTLEFAKELGGEDNLPQDEDSPAVLVDVISAIRRALRPAFKEPPDNEPAVQDQVEVILRAQGVEFERESQMQHATKKVKPDFALTALNTALEVKFCNSTRREKEIIEEIGADIVAYRKKYQIIIFVIYDVATIADKDAFRAGFVNEPGVMIEIIS